MSKTLVLERDDFKPLSDDSTYFDVILDNLGIPRGLQPSIDSIDVEMRDDYCVAFNKKGERVFSVPSNF